MLEPSTAPNPSTAAFDSLVHDEWTRRLAEFPRLATQAGVHEHDHRLERVDAASRAARQARWRGTRAALQRIDATQLPTDRKSVV